MRTQPVSKLRVYWPFSLRGTETSGNYGHKGRPGQVGGSAPGDGDTTAALESANDREAAVRAAGDDPPIVTDRFRGEENAALADKTFATMKEKLYHADEYGSTKFILPDGTRLGHDARTHAQALDQIGIDMWDAMRGGLVRREGTAGVEAGSPITHAQAGHILDGALTYGRAEVEVDIFFPHPSGKKTRLGKTQELRESKTFRTDSDNAADVIRTWVNGHYPHALSEREQAQWFLLYGNEHSGNYGHAGRPGEVGGSAPGGGDVRTFAGNDGYEWTEHDDRVKWASELPKADVDAINEYAGFGYGDINAHLRGAYTPNIVDEKVRDATPEEVASYKHPKFGRGEAHNYDENDPLNKVEDGRIVHHFTYEGGYKQNDQEANERNRRDWYTIEKAGPDTKYVKGLEKTADTINDSIRERGYVLPEAMSVNRAAYVPGLSYAELKSQEGGVLGEKGFTSTMVGNPSNRLDGYVMMGKSESIYKRTGGKSVESDEVGTAMRIEIVIPKGTKVAVVEPVRRIEYEYPRKVVPVPEKLKDDAWFKDHPETYTERDYTAKPTIKTDAITDKGSRREAEILIGSGAQYRIVSVEKAPPIRSSDGSMRPVEVVDVKLEYVGGGSSEGD